VLNTIYLMKNSRYVTPFSHRYVTPLHTINSMYVTVRNVTECNGRLRLKLKFDVTEGFRYM